MPPPIDMVGDASQVLSTVGANRRLVSGGLTGGGTVVSFGAFVLPRRARPWESRALRRKAQGQMMRSVVQVAPAAAVIALDAADNGDASQARALGKRLAQDVPYVSAMRFGHRLPTLAVVVHGHEGRERLAAMLLRGHFHDSVAYREVVIDADDLPRPGRRSLPQMSVI